MKAHHYKGKKLTRRFFWENSRFFLQAILYQKMRLFRPNSITSFLIRLIFAQNLEGINTDQLEKTAYQNIFSSLKYAWSKFDFRWSKTLWMIVFQKWSFSWIWFIGLTWYCIFTMFSAFSTFSERISPTTQPLHTFFIRNLGVQSFSWDSISDWLNSSNSA